jgi:hypothetical protein
MAVTKENRAALRGYVDEWIDREVENFGAMVRSIPALLDDLDRRDSLLRAVYQRLNGEKDPVSNNLCAEIMAVLEGRK